MSSRIQSGTIYQGDSIGKGRKSLTYRFIYQSTDCTLTDEATNTLHGAIMEALKAALQADIRT